MTIKIAASLCLGMALFSAVPAPAAEGDACLQNNRIWSWRMVDDRTLVVTDVTHKDFTVHTTGPCTGLTNAADAVAFHSFLSLGCLQSGDQIQYRAPGLGRLSCFIDQVKPGLPEKKPADKAQSN